VINPHLCYTGGLGYNL